ncbi:hypothetical protein PHISCL_09405 [Aspergillus sclerotialis]|uniref:Uncharacterized protein n=1 Tax=Aspergillus sclerotialis TaxID=2070753 RepID=A0A3A2Z5B6_9EURO|nr:hypothetical protein PHISCL_09405 [Aspergillus sclerotialis]
MSSFPISPVHNHFKTMPYRSQFVTGYESFDDEPVFGSQTHGTTMAVSTLRGTKVYQQNYLYICCQCNDGPKLYNVQPVCIVCEHKACKWCSQVK